MAQLVECPALGQAMIPCFVGSTLTSGSVVTAGSLEPTSESVSPSFCPSPTRTLSLLLKKKQTLKKPTSNTSTEKIFQRKLKLKFLP